MKPKVLKTELEYETALARVASLMNATQGPRDTEELELLGLLVTDYEQRHYPIGPPQPIDAIKFHIDRLGLSARQVATLFGTAARAREVLAGRKPITLALARKMCEVLGVSADTFMQAPPKARASRSKSTRSHANSVAA